MGTSWTDGILIFLVYLYTCSAVGHPVTFEYPTSLVSDLSRENINIKEGQPDSTPVDNCAWTTKGV